MKTLSIIYQSTPFVYQHQLVLFLLAQNRFTEINDLSLLTNSTHLTRVFCSKSEVLPFPNDLFLK